MMQTKAQDPITPQLLRKFGLVTGIIFILLFGLIFPFLRHKPFYIWPFCVAISLWVPALFYPTLLSTVYRVWMTIGHLLGWINTRIVLLLIFFLVITPIGFILRLMGKNSLNLRYDLNAKSYRVLSKQYNIHDMEKPF